MGKYGHPDWGQAAATEFIATMPDLGELAARLGSPVVFQRTGNVFFIDSFDEGLADWLQSPAAGTGKIELRGDVAFRGPAAVRLYTDASSPGSTYLTKRFQPPFISKIGMEVTFSCVDAIRSMILTATLVQGGKHRWYMIQIRPGDDSLRVFGGDELTVVFGTQQIDTGDPTLFHTAKVVIDLVNKRFDRFYLDQEAYNLEAYQPIEVIDVTSPRLEVSLGVTSGEAVQHSVIIDNFIFTINEP